ncbi:uncharacterized protein LOC142237890 [Haematobia irritans]|uniref:uncharacterized protein LOC142237890 n=1 Tax=Haematobia irritans TaxID=7368 RepID=UPI003F500904
MFGLALLLLISCESLLLPGIKGIHFKQEKQWRPNSRQDLYTTPRFYVWKSLFPQQMYIGQKTPIIPAQFPMNFYRYGFPHISQSMHKPNYILPLPANIQRNYPYGIVKDSMDKRKPAGYHHITIINALIPKPHIPPPPTHQTPQHLSTFQNYRSNRQLYNPYPNIESTATAWSNITRIPIIYRSPQITLQTQQNRFWNRNESYGQQQDNELPCGRKSMNEDLIPLGATYCNVYPKIENISFPLENTKNAPTSSITEKSEIITTGSIQIPLLPKPLYRISTTLPPTTAHTTTNYSTFFPIKQSGESIFSIKPTLSHIRNGAQHSFFTIEDAITKMAPLNKVFNSPMDAYEHAKQQKFRSEKIQQFKRINLKSTAKSFFHNFFDDNNSFESIEAMDEYSPVGSEKKEAIKPNFSYKNENIEDEIFYEGQPNLKSKFFENWNVEESTESEQYKHYSTTPSTFAGKGINGTTSNSLENGETFPTLSTMLIATTTDFPNRSDEMPIESTTTIAPPKLLSSTLSSKIKFNKVNLKRPFFQVLASAQKYPKTLRSQTNAFKTINVTSTSQPSSAITKKPNKYRRYKSKKNKHLKYAMSFTTSTTQTPSADANNIPTTTPSSIVSSTSPNPKKEKPQRTQSTNRRNSKRVQSTSSTEKPLETALNKRRGTKSRKRQIITAKTTPLSVQNLKTSSTTTTSQRPALVSSQISTNNSKSTIRPHHQLEPRTKYSNTIRNETHDIENNQTDNSNVSQHKDSSNNVPPLPIEIYFKKSQYGKNVNGL